MDSNFVKVGTLQKSFGTDGFIKFKIFPEFKAELARLSFLWIAHDDYYVPYRIKEVRNDKKLIQFDDIIDSSTASPIHNKSLYLPSDDMDVVIEDHAEDANFLLGLNLYDNDEFIAEVKELKTIASFLYGVIHYNEKEVLFPIHEDLILEIDLENKILRMNLPKGILEL